MKQIIMDDEIFSLQEKYGGISRLHSNYLNFFKFDHDINFLLPFQFSNNIHLYNVEKKLNFFKDISLYKKHYIIRKLNKICLFKEIKKNKHDILHLTYMDIDLLKINKKKTTCVIHDTIPENYPKYFKNIENFMKKKKFLIEGCNKIITVSHSTKNDLMKFYNISKDKFQIIYPPIDNLNAPVFEKTTLPSRFIIYVGNRHGYKNFNIVLNLLNDQLKNLDVKLLCVGGEKLNSYEKNFLSKNNLNNFFFHKSLNDNQLNFAYQKAIYFIFSSQSEGFGIPILEAQRNRCIVLCNKISAFEEVGSKSVLFYKDYKELLSLSKKIVDQEYSGLVEEGVKNLNRFSNENIKKQLKNFYLNI